MKEFFRRRFRIVETKEYNTHPDRTPYVDTWFWVQSRFWFFGWDNESCFKDLDRARKYVAVQKEIQVSKEVEVQ